MASHPLLFIMAAEVSQEYLAERKRIYQIWLDTEVSASHVSDDSYGKLAAHLAFLEPLSA